MDNYDLPQLTGLISSHCLACTESVLMSVMKRSRFCFRFYSTAYCVFRLPGILIIFIINSERRKLSVLVIQVLLSQHLLDLLVVRINERC